MHVIHWEANYNAVSEFSKFGGNLRLCMFNKLPEVAATGRTSLAIPFINSLACPSSYVPQLQLHHLDIHSLAFTRLWTPQEQELCFVHYVVLDAQHHAWQKGTEKIFLKNEGKVIYFQLLQRHNSWISFAASSHIMVPSYNCQVQNNNQKKLYRTNQLRPTPPAELCQGPAVHNHVLWPMIWRGLMSGHAKGKREM